MDGGIDKSLSTIIFLGIEQTVKKIVKFIDIKTSLGRPYLPIGSSIIIDIDKMRSLVVSPTMLLPQDVSRTKNAYYATMAVLYNVLIQKQENIDDVDILLTSLCCGYGKMDINTSIEQIMNGIQNYENYKPDDKYNINNVNIIINEPNLKEQPDIYQNKEWFDI